MSYNIFLSLSFFHLFVIYCNIIGYVVNAKKTDNNKPELLFGVTAHDIGISSKNGPLVLGTFEPTVKWTHTGSNDICDYSVGVDIKEEIGSSSSSSSSNIGGGGLTYNVFGTIKRTVADNWYIKGRVDTTSYNLNLIDTSISIDGGPTNVLLNVQGTVDLNNANKSKKGTIQKEETTKMTFTEKWFGTTTKKKEIPITTSKTRLLPPGCTIKSFGIEQPYTLNEGNGAIALHYNVNSKVVDCTVAYGIDDTSITLNTDSTFKKQSITIQQKFNEGNDIITPTISSNGNFQLQYQRKNVNILDIISEGTITGIYKPNNSVTIRYDNYPLSAKLQIPIQGYYKFNNNNNVGTKLSIQRSLPSFM